jgi:hypothetical protein
MGPLRAGCVTAHRLADLGGSHGGGEQRARERRSVGDVWGGIPDAKLATELPGAISSGAASSDPARSSRRSSLRPPPWARSSPASASRGWMEASELMERADNKKNREARRADKRASDAIGRPRPSISVLWSLQRQHHIVATIVCSSDAYSLLLN